MKITANAFFDRKKGPSVITMLTAYDFPCARIADECDIDVVLVGDSVGTNVLGYDDIRQVSMGDMLHHVAAVARGVKRSFILCDMPYRSCETSSLGLENAKKAHGSRRRRR